MRLLCDHNVASKYVQTFERADNIAVTTVAKELSPAATDEEIVRLAESEDWIILTTDDDFFEQADGCGLIVYSQFADPPPGEVLKALSAIDKAYTMNSEILETVPGNWV